MSKKLKKDNEEIEERAPLLGDATKAVIINRYYIQRISIKQLSKELSLSEHRIRKVIKEAKKKYAYKNSRAIATSINNGLTSIELLVLRQLKALDKSKNVDKYTSLVEKTLGKKKDKEKNEITKQIITRDVCIDTETNTKITLEDAVLLQRIIDNKLKIVDRQTRILTLLDNKEYRDKIEEQSIDYSNMSTEDLERERERMINNKSITDEYKEV